MRRIALFLALIISLTLAASAQTSPKGSGQTSSGKGKGSGYVFGSGGVTDRFGDILAGEDGSTIHIGGGGEFITKNGLGIGGELGYLANQESIGDGIGTFSINGSYHFLKSSKPGKVVPFVTGGYTGFLVTGGYTGSFRGDYANGINFGAGINYWFKPRVGLRFEFRDNVWLPENAQHFFNFRVGLTFR